jgi:hypothetical protein
METVVITAELSAHDFATWLARKHAQSERAGTVFKLNFARLPALINEFRLEHYPTNTAAQLPEVHEIEAAVRKFWAAKSAESRRNHAEAKRRAKQLAAEAERQYRLPF